MKLNRLQLRKIIFEELRGDIDSDDFEILAKIPGEFLEKDDDKNLVGDLVRLSGSNNLNSNDDNIISITESMFGNNIINKPSIPNVSIDKIEKIDMLAKDNNSYNVADSIAHSFGYPEDRSYSKDLKIYEVDLFINTDPRYQPNEIYRYLKSLIYRNSNLYDKLKYSQLDTINYYKECIVLFEYTSAINSPFFPEEWISWEKDRLWKDVFRYYEKSSIKLWANQLKIIHEEMLND